MLELRSLGKSFGGIRALDGVDLRLEAGRVHALCGENGAGKSTLLKVLAGVHPHGSYGGEILLDGRPCRFRGPRDSERAGIALVAQELNLVPSMSAAENVFLGSERRRGWRVDWKAGLEQAGEALARLGFEGDPRAEAGSLSVGQAQLVEIARALAKRARVLILDEPSAALPESEVERLLARVRELARQGVAVVYVSHRLDEVFRVADAISVLRDGRSVASGPAAGWTRASLVRAMVGRELGPAPRRAAPAPAAAPALELEGWTLQRPGSSGRPALQGLSLSLRRGEILGLGGLMGSGRSALLASLFGSPRAALAGRLRLGGGDWRGPFRSPAEAMGAGLFYLGEDRKGQGLLGESSVLENMALCVLDRGLRGGLAVDWPGLRALAAERARELRLKAASLDEPARSLSGGNQQKLLIARALLRGPGILLLDEPTRGIDVGAREEIYGLIEGLAAAGLAVLLASSDLAELHRLCDRLLVLSAGRRSAEFEGSGFDDAAFMEAATA